MRPLMREMVREAARHTHFSEAEILGRSKRWELARLRFKIWRKAYESGRSSVEIGNFFHRDHTTVLHGIREAGGEIRTHSR